MLVKIGYGHVVNTEYVRSIRRDAHSWDEARWVIDVDPSMTQPANLTWPQLTEFLESVGWDGDEIKALLAATRWDRMGPC